MRSLGIVVGGCVMGMVVHVLIFQTDSGVCAPLAAADSALRAALQHEYCGAPWPPQNDPQVGNGGFSLRDIDATRRLLLSRRQVPKGSEVPEDLMCPLTLELFHDPVTASDGHT